MKSLLENYLEGDAWGKMFTFPKPEIRLRREYLTKSEYDEVMFLASQLAAKFGSSYFDNVMVNTEDEELRINRLHTIGSIYKMFKGIADIKEITV